MIQSIRGTYDILEELKSGSLVLRDMATKLQRNIREEELLAPV